MHGIRFCRRRIGTAGLLALVVLCAASGVADATDLPAAPEPLSLPMAPAPQAVIVPPRPAPPRPVAEQPSCRLVPQPQMNISGEEVNRIRPTWVCTSRGLYADRMPRPPHPPRPWWWLW